MSEVAARLQTQRRAWAHPGSSHDRLVRLLLIVLPIGIAVLGVGLVVAPLMTGAEVSFVLDKNKVDVASERLRVQSAEYRGEDAKGQAFKLNAGSAVQKSSTDAEVQLSDLNAQLGLPEGPATVRADKGRYNLQNDQVAIDGPIAFRTADGYTLDTHDATLDLKTRQLRSGGAVTGRTPTGTFSGDKLTADLEQRTVRVDGNARLRIYPKRANRQ
ncbi:MAG: LPS export ABC transporter periplasmic protein LptC [Sphingomonas sp.]